MKPHSHSIWYSKKLFDHTWSYCLFTLDKNPVDRLLSSRDTPAASTELDFGVSSVSFTSSWILVCWLVVNNKRIPKRKVKVCYHMQFVLSHQQKGILNHKYTTDAGQNRSVLEISKISWRICDKIRRNLDVIKEFSKNRFKNLVKKQAKNYEFRRFVKIKETK